MGGVVRVYIATSVSEEPVDELFEEIVVDDQELADLAFWMIIRENWPSVVKTGCTARHPRALRRRPLGPVEPEDVVRASTVDPFTRSPPRNR
jgi:hypothetical protein